MKIVLDMDTGVDDAVAMVLAHNSPELEVVAVTSVAGNAPVDRCTCNCLLLREMLGGSFPVAGGAASPLSKELLTAPEVHGEDGLGGMTGSLPAPEGLPSEEPAHELLIRLARDAPGELTLVTTGPLTNVALALTADPEAVAMYSRLIVMGGAFDVPGNTGPVAEFNIYVDPEAAAAVLGSGLEVTLVPLDATTGAFLARSEVEGRPGSGPPEDPRPGRDLAAVLYRALDYYIRFQFGESGLDAGYMHDPLAVASALEPALLRTRRLDIEVVTDGPDRGLTRRAGGAEAAAAAAATLSRPPTDDAAARGRGVRVAFGHDPARFQRLLAERVLDPVFGAPRR